MLDRNRTCAQQLHDVLVAVRVEISAHMTGAIPITIGQCCTTRDAATRRWSARGRCQCLHRHGSLIQLHALATQRRGAQPLLDDRTAHLM